jgi:hypothetical protein
MARCQRPFPVAAERLVVVFRLDVTVEDFVLVDDVADASGGEKEGEDCSSRSNC